MDRSDIIQTAAGRSPADLLLVDARVVNVFNGQLSTANIAVKDGWIAGLGDYRARKTVDLQGRVVTPGFIDAHVHIESAMISVGEFARAVAPRGVTTVIADPHEIANVLGTAGLRYMLACAEEQPIRIRYTLPSCVPATEMETAGARLTAADLEAFIQQEKFLALGEMMNFPGVIQAAPEVLQKIAVAQKARKPADGHCPGLGGKALAAYLAAGVNSDHECTSAAEAREKLAAGMMIMVREGTAAKNLDDLFDAITPRTYRRMMWCTDDRHPHDLLTEGSIDFILRRAIKKGLDPIMAVTMATLIPADYFGLRDTGAVAPGRRADLVVFNDLEAMDIERVYCGGIKVAQGGTVCSEIPKPASKPIPGSMRLSSAAVDLAVPAAGTGLRAIEIVPDQIVTAERILETPLRNGYAVADPDRDLLKLAVIERHAFTGNIGIGFVRGFGLKRGALASSVAHDSHNIVVAGTADSDMHAAVNAVVAMQGGLAVVSGGNVDAALPLPVGGLMSDAPLPRVCEQLDRLLAASRALGSRLRDPFMTLSFLALPVIPHLKLTDKGLVDVDRFRIVPLFVQ
jgi:adenine deaminase